MTKHTKTVVEYFDEEGRVLSRTTTEITEGDSAPWPFPYPYVISSGTGTVTTGKPKTIPFTT